LEIGAEEAIGLKRPREVNTSPGWRVAEALRALYDGRHGLPNDHPLLGNRQGEGDHVTPVRSYAEQLGDKWGWNADKGRYLTTEQAQACLDIYERSVDALNLHLTSKLPRPKTLKQRGFISRDFLPDASLIPADDLRQFYDELGNLAQTLRRPSRRSSR
jgi:hypothetical protein